jgi:putative hydrolase of the HAD superfamily
VPFSLIFFNIYGVLINIYAGIVILNLSFAPMLKNVRHIIFDLGGVLLNIDYNHTIKAFESLGIEDFEATYSQAKQNSLFDDLETGKITKDEFVSGIQKLSKNPLSEEQIIEAWNSLIMDFPLRRLQLLQQLRLYHDLFLLSNTNEIHELAFNKVLSDAHGMPNLGVFFDRVYLSHKVGLRKPDTAIFQLVLDENNLKAEHTLFIDDSPQHIEAAKSLGIQTIYLEKGMTIEEHVFLPKK